MTDQEKTYSQKLVDSLRMEADLCAQCAGHGGESSGDFFQAMALVGRKFGAAADEIDRLRAGLTRIAEGYGGDVQSLARNLLEGKV